mmetsp:Transcript_13930/g.11910  ORF Transcript_13930/g.11910 Transcript_13930/m.11910 type:complete len:95 (+) Transcript_13930:47-331(+)
MLGKDTWRQTSIKNLERVRLADISEHAKPKDPLYKENWNLNPNPIPPKALPKRVKYDGKPPPSEDNVKQAAKLIKEHYLPGPPAVDIQKVSKTL